MGSPLAIAAASSTTAVAAVPAVAECSADCPDSPLADPQFWAALVADPAPHMMQPDMPFPIALAPDRSFGTTIPPTAAAPSPPPPPAALPADTARAAGSAVAGALVAVLLMLVLRWRDNRAAVSAGEQNAAAESTGSVGAPPTAESVVQDKAGEQGAADAAQSQEEQSSNETSTPATGDSAGATGRKKRNRIETIGKLRVDTGAVLGHGSHGTVVFKVNSYSCYITHIRPYYQFIHNSLTKRIYFFIFVKSILTLVRASYPGGQWL